MGAPIDLTSQEAFASWYATCLNPARAKLSDRLAVVCKDIDDRTGWIEAKQAGLLGLAAGGLHYMSKRSRRRVGEWQEQLTKLRAERWRIEQDLKVFDCDSDALDGGRAMFMRICKVPRVRGVTFAGEKLTITTERLYCFGPTPGGYEWFALGEYTIRVPVTNAGALWIVSKCQRPSAWLAPQVPKDGRVNCFGDEAKRALEDAYKALALDTVVHILVRFTECPNTSGVMEGWSVVKTSEVPAWYKETPLKWGRPE